MKQFDVCRLKKRSEQLVVVLQHDVADELATRVVAPLSDQSDRHLITRLRIPVEFEGGHYVLELDRMAAIGRPAIGNAAGSLAIDEQQIKNGIDFLFFGV